jgi:anaerobic magnesium-protoporphyrin IX monomethyl ester cyclase
MKSILFSHSYFLRFDPKQWATGQPYAPIGTLYAAALMREKGYTVSFFDTMFAHAPEDIIPSLKQHNPDFLILYDDGFNYLTKMCLTNMREAAYKMIKLAK